MTWFDALPAALVAIALLLVPGLLLTCLAGLRGLAAWAIAPAVSIAMFSVTAIAASVLGIRWSVPMVGGVTAGLAGLAGLTLLVPRFRRGRVPVDERGVALWAAIGVAFSVIFGGIAFGWGIISPEDLNQSWDAVFHYNALAAIRETGDASSLTINGLGVPGAGGGFYPAAWHAAASLSMMLSGAGIPVAANVFSAVVAVIVWPLGCALLVRQLCGPSRAAIGAAGALSLTFAAFPWGLIAFGVLWPNQLGLSLVPVGLAAVISIAGIAQQDAIGRTRALILLPVIVVGMGLAHPSAVFGLAVIALFPLGIMLLRWARRQSRPRAVAGVGGAVLGVVLVKVVLDRSPIMAGIQAFDWNAFVTPARGIGEIVLNAPNGKTAAWLLSALVVIGAVSCFRQRTRRWLVGGHVMFALLYLASAAYEGRISLLLTGFWYNDSYRLAAMMPLTGVPLAVIGLLAVVASVRSKLAGWASKRPERQYLTTTTVLSAGLMLVLALTTDGLYAKDHAIDVEIAYRGPGDTGVQNFVDQDKHALFSRMRTTVPEDVLVAGSPLSGTSMIWPVADRKVLFPKADPATKDQEYLGLHLKDAATDPKVCELVTRHRVGFMVIAPNRTSKIRDKRLKNFAGIAYPGPGLGFELIDEQGEAQLYRITACGVLAAR